MLKIIKLKIKNTYKNFSGNSKYSNYIYKESGPMIRNWKNSIYVYNKKNITLISEINEISINLIKNYFNAYYSKTKNFFRTRLIYKKYLTSKHRIFFSDAQVKHTNDLVNITIYFYDPKIRLYLSELRKKKYFIKKKNKLNLLKMIGKYFILKQRKITKNILLNNFDKCNFKNLKLFTNLYYNLFLNKTFKIAKLYLYILQLIYINKSKFRNNYLQGLVNIIKKLYKKNVQFNFVNIKYYFFNSQIITQRFVLDIQKNRKYLNKSLKKIIKNIPLEKKSLLILYPNNKYIFNWNFIKDNYNKLDITNDILYDILLKNKSKSNNLKKTIFDDIKYKKVAGIKLQANGRLTRRFTAARSLTKNKIKGSIANINSSFYGNSSNLLRGKFRSNIDYTNLNNNSALGSFGIKGWLSGY